MPTTAGEVLITAFEDHVQVVRTLAATQQRALIHMAHIIADCIVDGGTVYLCGNGGSAADCQHMAAELVGRFKLERPGYPAVALTTDTSILTAVANDYGYDQVFLRQAQALMQSGDVLVCFSTSGQSPSVVRAAEWAKENDMYVLALTGGGNNPLATAADYAVYAPSKNTARVQEAHALCIHIMCELIEEELSGTV